MENRYTNLEAARQVGVTKNTLWRWEERKKKGDPRYADFPVPPRIAHSNHRVYTDADIARIKAWKDRIVETTESAAPAAQ